MFATGRNADGMACSRDASGLFRPAKPRDAVNCGATRGAGVVVRTTTSRCACVQEPAGRYRLHVTSDDEQHLVAHYRPNACAQRTALACDDPSSSSCRRVGSRRRPWRFCGCAARTVHVSVCRARHCFRRQVAAWDSKVVIAVRPWGNDQCSRNFRPQPNTARCSKHHHGSCVHSASACNCYSSVNL